MRCLRKVTIGMAIAAVLATMPAPVGATPEFVNGFTLDGAMLDRSGGKTPNTGRVGFFSDIYYDPQREEWWGLSGRGPGGGFLNYETRVQRFRLKVDKKTGAIGKFKILDTIIFKDEFGNPLDGIAPSPTNVLGNAFDPEGLVIGPKNHHFLFRMSMAPSFMNLKKTGKDFELS
ncbi:hypothetical protein W02_16750 [Nitrospira sp. KM1]|nr:hypothetical protein W02_16750 [Nitrospira sp. KM1]